MPGEVPDETFALFWLRTSRVRRCFSKCIIGMIKIIEIEFVICIVSAFDPTTHPRSESEKGKFPPSRPSRPSRKSPPRAPHPAPAPPPIPASPRPSRRQQAKADFQAQRKGEGRNGKGEGKGKEQEQRWLRFSRRRWGAWDMVLWVPTYLIYCLLFAQSSPFPFPSPLSLSLRH